MRHTKTAWYEGLSDHDRKSVEAAMPSVNWIWGSHKSKSCDLVIISPWTRGVGQFARAIASLKPSGILIFVHIGNGVPLQALRAVRSFGKSRLVFLAQRNLSANGLLMATIFYLRDDFDMALASKYLGKAMQHIMDDDEELARSWGFKVSSAHHRVQPFLGLQQNYI